MRYNYQENVKEDIKNYILENYEKEEIEGLTYDELYDELWVEDSVTGNGSGSYTFNTWQAEENITHNHDLLKEAQEAFDCLPTDYICKGAEWADVTIRCYLLGQLLEEALEEVKEEVL